MNYGSLKLVDIADGPGVRVGLYVSGCERHCPGCHNAVAWDPAYGKPFDGQAATRLLDAMHAPWIRGLSVLGGEPLDPDNLWDINNLLWLVRKELPRKDVWLYTGYTWGELLARDSMNGKLTREVLDRVDVLVDGPFIEAQKDIRLKFRGSTNQRIIDVPKSLKDGQPVLWEDEKWMRL